MDPRRCLPLALVAAFAITSNAVAEETWVITSGRTAIHLYEDLLSDLGIAVIDVDETAADPTGAQAHMEPPFYTFAIDEDSGLEFRSQGGRYISRSFGAGELEHLGGFRLHHAGSGFTAELRDFVIDYRQGVDGPGEWGVLRDWLFMRGTASSTPMVELWDSEPVFRRGEQTLHIYNLTLQMSEEMAIALGREDLIEQPIGSMYVEGAARFVEGVYEDPHDQEQTAGSVLDVELGHLYTVTSLGHSGTYPNGIAGISMSTTSCNPGDVEVPWEAPMDEDHPIIMMQFYRINGDGQLDQIGTSWGKHGFYALSSNECGYGCSGTDGTALGVGCSDTYGTGNNGDRYWLGPRDEINPYTGTWTCTGSFFSGYQPDCTRRESGSGWGPTAHRLETPDQDLGNPDATYYFEGYYVVVGDQDRSNNIMHRRCTTSWSGSNWNINETGSQVQTPMIMTWGDQQTQVSGVDDGMVILSVKTTDLGGGNFRYDYALFNRDSDRQIREFSVPIGDATLSNMTFHDWDTDDGPASNDWTAAIVGNDVVWSTDEYPSEDGNPLVFGYMFSFSFEADRPPLRSAATLGYFKPGTGESLTADTQAPAGIVAVGDPTQGPNVAQLGAARPNPLRAGATTISFDMSARADVRLSIYDAQGRFVRSLIDETRSVGRHQVEWDGRDASGASVGAGVYYYRLQVGGYSTGKSLVVVD